MASPKRKSFPLRIDPTLWSEIESWAHQEFRSVNGQIEFLLRDAVRRRKGTPGTLPVDNQNDPNPS